MIEIPKKPCFLQEAYVDHFVIRGVKFARTAHLGEIFEVEYAPYEYVQAVKRIKTIKKVIVHKVDPTNLGLIGELIRKYQKQLTNFINYGPWMKKELDSLKKLVRNKKIIKVNVNEKHTLRRLPYDKNLQEITFNIPRPSEEDTLEKRDLRLRALRLNKLKRIIIEGHCESPDFEPFILNLERNLKYFKSLEDVRFLSVVMGPGSQKLLRDLNIFKLVKEIRIGFNEFSSSVVDFINHAELLPTVQKLTGLMAFQELETASKLEGFKNLKNLDLLFFRENCSYDLPKILNDLKLPKSIESLSLNLVHVEANAGESQKLEANIFGHLSNLQNLKLIATINPAIDNNQIGDVLETIGKANNSLKSIHLEFNNSMFFVQSQDLAPFDFSLVPLLTPGFPNITSLSLKLPLISFESFPENHQHQLKLLQISSLMLEGTFGIKYSENIGRFLNMIYPTSLNRLELRELEFNDPERISMHLGALGRMKSLQNVELIYKNSKTSNDLYHGFKDFTKNLQHLSFFSLKIDHQESRFEDFRKKLLEFVSTLPKLTFAQIDPYIVANNPSEA